MGRRLAGYVWLTDPETGRPVSFGPQDDVPGWAADLITNPAAWSEPDRPLRSPEEAPAAAPSVPDAPKGNASRKTWAEYADAIGVAYDADATRDEIRSLVEHQED